MWDWRTDTLPTTKRKGDMHQSAKCAAGCNLKGHAMKREGIYTALGSGLSSVLVDISPASSAFARHLYPDEGALASSDGVAPIDLW